MTVLLDKISGFIINLSADQMVALLLVIAAVSCAKKFVESGLSFLFVGIGVLAGLHFLAPDLYQTVLDLIIRVLTKGIAVVA